MATLYCFNYILYFTYYSLATAGEDYVGVASSVTFAPNQTMAMFQVTIIDDTFPEIPETFYIVLINATLVSSIDTHLGTDGKISVHYYIVCI